MMNRLLVLFFGVVCLTSCKTAQTTTESSDTAVSTNNDGGVPLEKKIMNTPVEPKKEHPHIKLKNNN